MSVRTAPTADGRRPVGLVFLCVANSVRSQIAEAIARSVGAPWLRVYSAGSSPRGVHPLAVEVLGEIGIDASAQRSKGMDEVPVDAIDVAVTLCAEEVCPAWPGQVRRIHWPLPDPSHDGESAIGSFRRVRDLLRDRIGPLIAEIAAASPVQKPGIGVSAPRPPPWRPAR